MKNVVRKQDLEVKFTCVTSAWLAQMGEHSSAEKEVMGSSPSLTNTHGL